MKVPQLSRRSFVRIISGLFAFIPTTGLLAKLPSNLNEVAVGNLPAVNLDKMGSEEDFKARIAEGAVLDLEGNSIWINDRYESNLRLVISADSIVWKGRYNTGGDFQSYPYPIKIEDRVVARGERKNAEFFVEKMYVNIVNIYIAIADITVTADETTLHYSDASNERKAVRVKPDYLIDKGVYKVLIDNPQQLHGITMQVIGLPLDDGTILASNILF